MTLFQIITVSACILMMLVSFARMRTPTLRWRSWIWANVWISAALVLSNPELSNVAAHQMGIGRGADLLIYSSVVITYFLFFQIGIRLYRRDRQITKLVRGLALANAEIDLLRSRVAVRVRENETNGQ